MPISVGIYELSRQLSSLVEQVERTGEPVLVTRQGRPAVMLVRAEGATLEQFMLAAQTELAELLRRAEEEGLAAENPA